MEHSSRAFDSNRNLGRTQSVMSKDYNFESRNDRSNNGSQLINHKISTQSIKDMMDSKTSIKNFSSFSKQKKAQKIDRSLHSSSALP